MRRFLPFFLIICSIVLASCSSHKSNNGDQELTEEELNAEREGRFGSGSIPTAEGEGMFRDIQFDFDSAVVDDSARQAVESNAEILREKKNLQIQLEGNADERGTAEYNLALGERRGQAVRDLLVSYGISSERIQVISYGEEIPLDPGHDESAWAKNRRVHFSASAKKQNTEGARW